MIFIAFADGWMDLAGARVRCALGRGGVKPATQKREGDGASPAGVWPLRRVLWRPDRGAPPAIALPGRPLAREDGWCEDPSDPAYNRQVTLPHRGAVDAMWREDHLYDLVVVLGHNDNPVIPGAGSAVFLHLARPDYGPTQGCVALARADLERLLALAAPGDALEIRA